MYEKSLKTLEYYKIVELLAAEAESQLGEEYAKSLKPSTNIEEVRKWLRETEEAFQLIIKRGNPPLYGVKPIQREIKRTQIGGSLTPEGLLKIAETLRCANALKKYLKDTLQEDLESKFLYIGDMIESLSTFDRIENAIYRAIISENEISDDASPKLRSIRIGKKSKSESIKSKLNKMITSEENKKYLQDSLFTVRDGRYVVPVKRDFRADVPGMVHDMSSSGATLFVEPMAVVELNNEIRELEIEERKEIERILAELSQMVGENSYEIGANEHLLRELDFIFAKGKLAIKQDGTKANLNTKGIINIKQGRHPLLDKKTVVPIDIYIGEGFETLVVTGPNTGGKTVSLKTVGLLTAMAQSGLFIPARSNSEIAVFDNIYADIGDEQSIEQSLSTFSSHMVNIVDIISRLEDNSLVLFDELGAGTDPTEGAVLAIAILEKLREKDVRTIATTHYNQLKVYAMTTEGVENASMEFDIDTLSPTFRLLIGIPGKSNAFEISKRLGLDESIINNARSLVETENIKFEDMLTEIEKNREIIEAEREQAEIARAEIKRLEERAKSYKEKTEEMREKLLEEARIEARNIIRNARDESKMIIEEIKDISKNIGEDSSRRLQEATDFLRKSEKNLDAHLREDLLNIRVDKPVEEIKMGDSVRIPSLNQEGTVLAEVDASGNVMVQVGIMKMNLPLNSLVPIESAAEIRIKERTKKMHTAKSKFIKKEIDLRGKNVEDAIFELDKYLDDAYLSGLKQVEVIHGKGTGALREGLQPYFKKHRHVKSARMGEYREGGMGVTILELK
ncbi:MAG: endonuclease MutS2 [Tissierellia bacterium]|nr:endonuclease MutS2 [Tissierellia bacterium]